MQVLSKFKEIGVRNILVLRGHIVDAQKSQNWAPPADGFQYAAQLVAFIRAEYQDYFCIAVGGYVEQLPGRHADRATDLAHLQAKVRNHSSSLRAFVECGNGPQHSPSFGCQVHAGADLVLTQFFFDTDAFKPVPNGLNACLIVSITLHWKKKKKQIPDTPVCHVMSSAGNYLPHNSWSVDS